MGKKKVPILRGKLSEYKPSGNCLIKVWCPFCCDYHTHGWVEGNSNGSHHRAAHCVENTPFRQGGYYIKADR